MSSDEIRRMSMDEMRRMIDEAKVKFDKRFKKFGKYL